MKKKKKTLKVYTEDWRSVKREAVNRDISIADLIKEKLKQSDYLVSKQDKLGVIPDYLLEEKDER